MPLKVKSSMKDTGIFIVSPIGSIDAHTHSVLADKVDEILAQQPDVIIFDMEFADYISSSGIRVLLKAKKALKETDGRLVFMNLQPQIQKVFEILKAIPSPLGLGSIELADGREAKGFLCEQAGTEGATDISAFGGWRRYVEEQA